MYGQSFVEIGALHVGRFPRQSTLRMISISIVNKTSLFLKQINRSKTPFIKDDRQS